MDPLTLGDEKYLLIRTFKRDGSAVDTPVWITRDPDRLVFWTVADSGKVKRIRNNPSIQVAPCDMRGKITGAVQDATAHLLAPEDTDHGIANIRKKYGVIGWLTTLGSRLRRGSRGTVAVAITF
ncbi:PPOX class F420-dependent oxidoreductase [Actinokineospora pegani]|uniref:PPOX class F420-dependent oxidoreductase n=1 Tax=Actinokineospora pegani TaxID=2654637 RepID=UPI0012E9DFF5|nr:PPOX class F420-dependent oxidoreductase [Actinokineospora pegani]